MTSISDTNVVNAPGGLIELGFGTSYGTTVTATSLSSSNTIIISDVTVICDGSPVIIDFSTPITTPAAIAGAFIQMALYRDGSTFLGYAPASVVPSAATDQKPASFQFRDTPTAGVHTYRVVAYRDGGAGTASIGGASAAGWMPNILRVSKIIQASQLIVQTPNAPLVTSLPSNAIDGQEVRYLADNTNGIVWNFRYRAGSSSAYKWEFIGGPPISKNGGNSSFGGVAGPSAITAMSGGITIPLAGDYDIKFGGDLESSYNNGSTYIFLNTTAATSLNRITSRNQDTLTRVTSSGSKFVRITGVNVSTTYNLYFASDSATYGFANFCFMTVTPVRVSA